MSLDLLHPSSTEFLGIVLPSGIVDIYGFGKYFLSWRLIIQFTFLQVMIIQRGKSSLDHPLVGELITWADSPRGQAVMGAATSGGYFSYPPLPKDLQLYKQLWSENRHLQVVTCF